MGDINLRLFLKKYTSISSTFIDKYCSFYDLCKKDKFGINVDLVVKYLEYTDSKRFYRRFRKTYTLNEDYVIKKNAVKAEKDVKLVEYFITIECFEKICMLSRSKMGNSVRDYFITLRQFINYYKNHIADTINHMAKPGKCVYIILANKNKNIQKIGRTENLRNRLRSYVTGKETHPDVKFIMLVDDAESVENCVKTLMKKYRFKNSQELYKVNIDALKNALFNCALAIKQIDQIVKNDNNIDAWIIYDDNEYLNTNGEVIGYEQVDQNRTKTKTSVKKPSVKKSSVKKSSVKKPSVKKPSVKKAK